MPSASACRLARQHTVNQQIHLSRPEAALNKAAATIWKSSVARRPLACLVADEGVAEHGGGVAGCIARADHGQAAARVARGVALEGVPRHLQVVGRLRHTASRNSKREAAAVGLRRGEAGKSALVWTCKLLAALKNCRLLTLASSPPPLACGAALPVKLHPSTEQPLAQLSCSVAPPPPPPLPALLVDADATSAAGISRLGHEKVCTRHVLVALTQTLEGATTVSRVPVSIDVCCESLVQVDKEPTCV